MAKKLIHKIQIIVNSDPLVENVPFSHILVLKCMGLIGKIELRECPSNRATPHTF